MTEQDNRRLLRTFPASRPALMLRDEPFAFMTNARARYKAAVERTAPDAHPMETCGPTPS